MNINTRDLSFLNFNGTEMQWLKYNNLLVWEAWEELKASGLFPLTLNNSGGKNLVGYKIYGNSIQEEIPTLEAPVEIKSVGEYDETTGMYKIPIRISGKNVKDLRDILNENGEITKEGNSETVPIIRLNNINEKAGKYTFSSDVEVNGYDGSGSMLAYGYSTAKDNAANYGTFLTYSKYTGPKRYSFDFTVDDGDTLIFFYIYIASKCTKGTITLKNPMLARDNTDITYEPYVEPMSTNIYINKPLMGIGENADYIDFKNKNVVRNIGIYEVNGTENWYTTQSSNNEETLYFYSNSLDKLFKSELVNGDINCICDSIEATRLNDVYSASSVKECICVTSKLAYGLRCRIKRARLSDEKPATFKQWLEENPLNLYYPMAEEKTEPIEELPNIPTHKGTTILEVETTIQPSNAEVVYRGKT